MGNSLVIKWVIAAVVAVAPLAASAEDAPVSIDSRIRTLVYSANEVFKMYTEYGYQSNIEFADNEQITTISLGSPSAFKITPSGNRLFVKALQNGRHTNMTVLTTKRAYQFELYSNDEYDDARNQVVYVMRFYYPENNFDEAMGEDITDSIDLAADSTPQPTAANEAAAPPLSASVPPEIQPEALKENYNYSLTGPEALSPIKVFDNGQRTFFKFNGTEVPSVYGVNLNGMEYPLSARRDGEYVVVDVVLTRYSLRQGSDVVCVFNESLPGAPALPLQNTAAR